LLAEELGAAGRIAAGQLRRKQRAARGRTKKRRSKKLQSCFAHAIPPLPEKQSATRKDRLPCGVQRLNGGDSAP
jgi:hypothetical protein